MQLSELLSVSINSIKVNKLRTFLTVLGVVVGIFSIIVIMTVITMLQNTIEEGFSQLNSATFQIQKYPAIRSGGPGSRAKYRNRKDITMEDFQRLKDALSTAKYIAAEQWQFGKIVKYGSKETNPNISIGGITLDAFRTNDWVVKEGREFRRTDIDYSADVCIMGKDVVEKLFPNINPINQIVRVDGFPIRVIGILKPQPSLFGRSRDNYILLPITKFQSMYGRKNQSVSIAIMAKSKEEYQQTIDVATGIMRKIRKVPPGEENDFEIFSNESLISQVNDITGGIKIGAMVVSFIALLAAGVGIMNIMLVSVTERTKEIGIRKAVGARKKNILHQFLFEAVILSLFGGFLGIFLGVLVGNIAGSLLNAQVAIPYDWIAIGLSLCILVGIIFGTYPAYKAANLDPIEALRYE